MYYSLNIKYNYETYRSKCGNNVTYKGTALFLIIIIYYDARQLRLSFYNSFNNILSKDAINDKVSQNNFSIT